MYEIKEIIIGNSESGNAGCNNGIYDRFVMIGFTNGLYLTETTCRCGCGCSGSFPANRLKIGTKYNSIQELYDSIYEEEEE